jgi:3-oxoacyl-[acyl-carrier protein] reductase
MQLQNQVAIVTGTNREIGAAIALGLARAGAAVLAAHYGEPERVAALLGQIAAEGGRALAHEADLTSPAANQALVARAVEAFGRLDIFAANAGLTVMRPFLETSESDWDTVVDLNLKGSFFGAQAAARQMVAQGQGGRIIFSSSVTGLRAVPELSAYGISKAGICHMAAVLSAELGPHGITVNALGIGATDNERNRAYDPNYPAQWAAVIPTRRCGQPEDVAAAALFLASPAARHVTGQTLVLDGGWTNLSPAP